MATVVKKQTASATRLVLEFDSPPTMDQLKTAINKTDVADRGCVLKRVKNSADISLEPPVRFVFVVEGGTEVTVP